MDHVRIAVYEIIRGTAKEAVEITHAPAGMADIFKAQPGFEGYSIIEVDPVTTVSLSFWATHEQAEHAIAEAAEWVQSNLADRLRRTSNYVGDSLFWTEPQSQAGNERVPSPEEQDMNHVRIAVYDVTKGTTKEVTELVSAPGGLSDIFKMQPGFQAYSTIEVDPVTLISLSFWETHEEAERAVSEAAVWTAAHTEDRVHRTSNYVGDSLFWAKP